MSELSTFHTDIKSILEQPRGKARSAVNAAMVEAYWLIGRFKSILRHHIVLGLADKQPYRRVVCRLLFYMIDCTYIYAQLSQMFCFKFRYLQFYDDIAAQFQMIEKQVGI